MARPTTIRTKGTARMPMVPDQLIKQPRPMLFPQAGMNTTLPLSELPPQQALLIENLVARHGAYVSRFPVVKVGAASSSALIYATDFTLSNKRRFLLRWRVDGVDYYVGGAWVPIPGPAFAVSGGLFSITGWGDALLFTGGNVGIYKIDFSGISPTMSVIADSPTAVIHMAQFGQRVVVSLNDKIKWSGNRDDTAWAIDDLGAGEEPLKSTPDGLTDSQVAVAPITDDKGFVLRTNSIWSVTTTGNVDAPFRFTRLYAGIGIEQPHHFVFTPQGVVLLTKDTVLLVAGSGGITDIGGNIHAALQAAGTLDKRNARLIYDTRENELRVSLRDAEGQHVYRHGFAKNTGWVKDKLALPLKSMVFSRYRQGTVINQLTGTINSLTGVINDLGVTNKTSGGIYTTSTTPAYVMRDDSAATMDDTLDSVAAVPFRVETGILPMPATPNKLTLTDVEIRYEATQPVLLTFEVSRDNGTTWTMFDQFTVPATNGPKLANATCSLTDDEIMLALSASDARGFRLISFVPKVQLGGEVTNAS